MLAALLASCAPERPAPPPPAPRILQLEVVPFLAPAGAPVNVRWAVEGAEHVTLAADDGEPTPVAQVGSRPWILLEDVTFTLIASGSGASVQARAAAQLSGEAEVELLSFAATPAEVRARAPVELTWETRGATRVSLLVEGGGGLTGDAPGSGSLVVRPTHGQTVVLIAEGPGGPRSSRARIDVRHPAPSIVSLRAVPSAVYAGEEVRLAWETLHAEWVEVVERHDDGSSHVLYTGDATPGAGALPLDSSTGSRELSLAATSPAGTATATTRLYVRAPSPPEITRFTVTPTVTGPGGTIVAAFEARFASRAHLSLDGAPPSVTAGASGSALFELTRTSTVFLEVFGPAGDRAVAAVEVTVDATWPSLEVTVAPDRLEPLGTATISWTSTRAHGVSLVLESEEVLFEGAPPAGAAALTLDTSTTLLVTALGDRGETTVLTPIRVAPRPRILELSAPAVARVGRPLPIAWRTEGASRGGIVAGNLNTLAIGPTEIAAGSRVLQVPAGSSLEVGFFADGELFTTTATHAVSVYAARAGPSEEEPNDTSASANGVYHGDPEITGELPPGDRDFFAVELPPGTRPRLWLVSPGCASGAHLAVLEQRADLGVRGPFADLDVPEGCVELDASTIPALALLDPIVIITLTRPDTEATPLPYTLSVLAEGVACGDGVVDRGEECDDGDGRSGDGCDFACRLEDRDELEPNDTVGQPLALDDPLLAFLGDDDVDLFTATVGLGEGGSYRLVLESPGAGGCDLGARVSVYDATLRRLAHTTPPPGSCPILEGPGMVLDPGAHHISIQAGEQAGAARRGPYVLTLTRIGG